ncbi:hypothetical protein pb186bvf_010473 [Paramecium bursaria]
MKIQISNSISRFLFEPKNQKMLSRCDQFYQRISKNKNTFRPSINYPVYNSYG